MADNKIPQPVSGNPGRLATRRRRRKKRGGMGCFGAMLYFCLIICISALFAGFGWLCADDLLALTKEDKISVIEVTEEDSVSTIADKLKNGGVIKYPWLFRLYGAYTHADEKIDPGSYQVNSIMDFRALISAMRETSEYRTEVSVTIPEGFTLKQILERLAENGVSSYEELEDACTNFEFDNALLEGLPAGEGRLEGYLFPDTYTFYVNNDPANAIGKFISNLSSKFTADMRTRAESLDYSISEILTIASLIEKEAANAAEMPVISSVIHNRLNSKNFQLLQIDATIQYILPERKAKLSFDDLKIDNPYNTYLYEGLPPGPICSPGLNAIKAALYPDKTKYYYYALTDEGVHAFAKNADEFQEILNSNPETYGS